MTISESAGVSVSKQNLSDAADKLIDDGAVASSSDQKRRKERMSCATQ